MPEQSSPHRNGYGDGGVVGSNEGWGLQFPRMTVPVRFLRQDAQSGAKLTYTPELASQ